MHTIETIHEIALIGAIILGSVQFLTHSAYIVFKTLFAAFRGKNHDDNSTS
jgi:hypothetical protein